VRSIKIAADENLSFCSGAYYGVLPQNTIAHNSGISKLYKKVRKRGRRNIGFIY